MLIFSIQITSEVLPYLTNIAPSVQLPNHTKLIIFHISKRVDFYGLFDAAATHVVRTRLLLKKSLNNCNMLFYPVLILLQATRPKAAPPTALRTSLLSIS